MPDTTATPSRRRTEILERCYAYVLQRGLSELSLRPLATAVGSSPRVLLYLFGSKEGLIRAVLGRARQDERELLDQLHSDGISTITETGERLWSWLATPSHRDLLTLWVEGYARSLVSTDGPWADFARSTVTDWLDLLADSQPVELRHSPAGATQRTAALGILRGALLDLLATGDRERTTAAVHAALTGLP